MWILLVSTFLAGRLLFQPEEKDLEELISTQELIIEGNDTYLVQLENYYNVEYGRDKDGFYLRIDNSCVKIVNGSGTSMKPYCDDDD